MTLPQRAVSIGLTTVTPRFMVNLGSNHRHYAEVTSTNDVARRLASDGAPAGTLVTADHQKAGRGRFGRRWLSPPGQSLLMSLILRPRSPGERLGLITVASALAVAEVIEEMTVTTAEIKWPNDIVIRGKKVSGLLLESAQNGPDQAPDFVILGIGVNVNQAEFPEDISDRATSLVLECGYSISRDELRDRILQRLSVYLDTIAGGDDRPLRQAYELRLVGVDRTIELASAPGNSRVSGILRGIGQDGQIVIETPGGTMRSFYAGEVTTAASAGEPR